jgi:hypothetical protein
MMDISPPALLWLASGLRVCGGPSVEVMDADILTDTGWLFTSLPCQVSRDVAHKCKEKRVGVGQSSGEKKTREDRDD